MGPKEVVAGSTDVSVVIRIMDSSDGTPETGVEHNTSGIDLNYQRQGEAVTSITEAALTALTDAHSDGGIEHIGNGRYRLDIPDAAFATGADYVDIGGTVTGMVVYGPTIRLLDPVGSLFRSYVIDSEPTTSVARVSEFTGYANEEINGELVWVYDDSADEWHPCWVTDFATTNGDFTLETCAGGGNIPFTIEDGVDRIWRSGLNRNNITGSDFSSDGTRVQADVDQINGVTITGDGSTTPFDV